MITKQAMENWNSRLVDNSFMCLTQSPCVIEFRVDQLRHWRERMLSAESGDMNRVNSYGNYFCSGLPGSGVHGSFSPDAGQLAPHL
jgi:hypothetical protein